MANTTPRSEAVFASLLLAGLPVCLYFWRGSGISVWLTIVGGFSLTVAIISGFVNAISQKRTPDQSVQATDSSVPAFVFGAFLILCFFAWTAEWEWSRGAKRTLVAVGVMVILNTLAGLARRVGYVRVQIESISHWIFGLAKDVKSSPARVQVAAAALVVLIGWLSLQFAEGVEFYVPNPDYRDDPTLRARRYSWWGLNETFYVLEKRPTEDGVESWFVKKADESAEWQALWGGGPNGEMLMWLPR